jgi:hypothetical protein
VAYVVLLTTLSIPATASSVGPPYHDSTTSPASTQSGGTCVTTYSGNIYISGVCAFALNSNGYEPIYADSYPCCGITQNVAAWGYYDTQGTGAPSTYSTTGHLYLIENMQYYGLVSATGFQDAQFVAIFEYHYTYCFNSPNIICNPVTVAGSTIIWDAAQNGNAYVYCSSCAWAHYWSGTSTNTYWASEGAEVTASAQSTCFITCTNPHATSNFNAPNYYVYITSIRICNNLYCAPN